MTTPYILYVPNDNIPDDDPLDNISDVNLIYDNTPKTSQMTTPLDSIPDSNTLDKSQMTTQQMIKSQITKSQMTTP